MFFNSSHMLINRNISFILTTDRLTALRYLSCDSLLLKGLVGGFECGHVLELHVLSCQAIFTVAQLHHLVDGVPHCAVILHHHRLHGLDQTTLDVTCCDRKEPC